MSTSNYNLYSLGGEGEDFKLIASQFALAVESLTSTRLEEEGQPLASPRSASLVEVERRPLASPRSASLVEAERQSVTESCIDATTVTVTELQPQPQETVDTSAPMEPPQKKRKYTKSAWKKTSTPEKTLTMEEIYDSFEFLGRIIRQRDEHWANEIRRLEDQIHYLRYKVKKYRLAVSRTASPLTGEELSEHDPEANEKKTTLAKKISDLLEFTNDKSEVIAQDVYDLLAPYSKTQIKEKLITVYNCKFIKGNKCDFNPTRQYVFVGVKIRQTTKAASPLCSEDLASTRLEETELIQIMHNNRKYWMDEKSKIVFDENIYRVGLYEKNVIVFDYDEDDDDNENDNENKMNENGSAYEDETQLIPRFIKENMEYVDLANGGYKLQIQRDEFMKSYYDWVVQKYGTKGILPMLPNKFTMTMTALGYKHKSSNCKVYYIGFRQKNVA